MKKIKLLLAILLFSIALPACQSVFVWRLGDVFTLIGLGCILYFVFKIARKIKNK